ncbi:MAG: hemolysin family protein [Thermodesulfobacteriota bacterium]
MSAEGFIFQAVVILLLILLNGFFSGAEIAIISSRRAEIDRLAKEGRSSAENVKRMKERPESFLATVQVGVTIVSTIASVLGGILAIKYVKPLLATIPIPIFRHSAEFIAVVLVVVVISYTSLIVGELVPKSLALRYAEKIACFSARPLILFTRAASIIVLILTSSTKFVLKILGVKDSEERTFISEEEIKYFIKEGRATGVFEETEAALLHGIFQFADTTVREVMVPKPKFSAIDIATPSEAVLKIISDAGFSRYPVYKGSVENIAGILFNKDVFRIVEKGEPIILSEIMREPYFVPATILISKLLREMQRRKVHIAIVVDEHGDVDGLVTIEDILEEIVGEIEDEYDVGKGGLVVKLKDGAMIIDATISIGDLEEEGIFIDSEAEGEEFNTLAGFLLYKLQRIPKGGEFVIYKDRRFTIVDVEANRIVKVKVEPLSTGARRVKATA